MTAPIDWEELTTDTFTRAHPAGWGSAAISLDDPPVPQLRATRDAMPVLLQIRALLAIAVIVLVALLIAVITIGYQVREDAPTQVVLSLAGDPAPDYMAHVVLADGTERDVRLGSLLLDSPVRISLHANSPADGTTSCLIELDGAVVASETMQNAGTATCDWEAS